MSSSGRYAGKALLGAAAAFVFGSVLSSLMDEEHEFVGTPAMRDRAERVAKGDMHGWHPEHYFINKDGLAIFYRQWLPVPTKDPAPKAIVVISHGLGEYSMRYTELARSLTRLGYAVYALDHQGHGQSEGTRGYVKHFSDLVHDVHFLTEMAKKKHPAQLKTFLLGHSMGSLIAIHAVHEAPRLYAGVVLSAPPLKVAVPPGLDTLGPVISAYLPKLPGPPLDITTLCDDAGVLDRYHMDPLISMGSSKFRLLAELIRSIDEAQAFAQDFPTPYLLMHGTADKMALYRGSVTFHEATKVQDKKFVSYENAMHELFNNADKHEMAIKETVNWLEARL